MDKNVEWHSEIVGKKVVKALQDNNFAACYVKDGAAALDRVLSQITAGASVGIGGSMTLNEIGLIDALDKGDYVVYNHNKPGFSPAESLQIRRNELTADVFIASANAVTLDGELVNIDGSGNRVAGMAFGPGKVFIIVGINKIVNDIPAALDRIKNVAAPINAKRLHRKTPCAITGECADCSSPDRICCITTIMNRKPLSTDIEVIVIGEEYGY